MKAIIVDGYVDEPALFGVPPFISTYARYAWGAYRLFGVDAEYWTIDQIRQKNLWDTLNRTDHLVIIGGVSVPGKYVGGAPLSFHELEKIVERCPDPLKILFGAFTFRHETDRSQPKKASAPSRPVKRDALKAVECLVTGNLETYLYYLLSGKNPPEDIAKETEKTELCALAGAGVVGRHPNYPNLICEIEVSSGCERRSHCSFCSEPLFHKRFVSRDPEALLAEVAALGDQGVKHFRLGRTANILAYGDQGDGPDPRVLRKVYQGFRERVTDLRTLHTDNANPQYIAEHPVASARILETIAEYNTPGDILSFGVESFDETVIRSNNLGTRVESIFQAIKLVNEIGGVRKEGIPALLPGINLIAGLIGETKSTFVRNLEALKKITEEGWLLRRINLRQVMIFPETPLWAYRQSHYLPFHHREFQRFKEKVRTEIDRPMLQRVFPTGTTIRDVITEYLEGNNTFGRPLWTYGILVGIREPLPIGEKWDVTVTEHGFRSLTGRIIQAEEP
ncbi:MAG TPA: radical SAM protein [Thermotogota bacterium]|nr:radical SAM protein [Thermotogota bacterium]